MDPFDLVIIGGGPAGLAATAYALHLRLKTALVSPNLGGWVAHPFTLRDMPTRDTVWGASLVREFEMRVRANLDHHYLTEVGAVARLDDGAFKVTLVSGVELVAGAVILATGAQPQRLHVDGEVKYWSRGLSFSAISHAPYFRDRAVAVVGSGSRAVHAALELAPIASGVHFILTGADTTESLPDLDRARTHPHVKVYRGWELRRVNGDEYVSGIDLVGDDGETRSLEVEGVFIQNGLVPNNALVRSLAALDADGHVLVNHRCESSVPGLYAAGDVTSIHAEQVPVSLGEGSKAALSAWEYLSVRGGLLGAEG